MINTIERLRQVVSYIELNQDYKRLLNDRTKLYQDALPLWLEYLTFCDKEDYKDVNVWVRFTQMKTKEIYNKII